MTDVLFAHSYFLQFDLKELRAMMPYPPLGTLYAAAAARQSGLTVSLFDSMLASSPDEVSPLLASTRPRVFVIYDDDFNYLTKMCLTRMREAAFYMSRLAANAGCIVIVHGSDAADHAEKYLTHGATYVIIGEGEETLVELLGCLLQERGTPNNISGLAYIREGAVHRTFNRQVTKDLDRLPLPARDLLDVDRYRRLWMKKHGMFSLNIVTTRGCPFRCNWCAKPIYGKGYNSRSPESVVDEMEFLAHTYHPDHLWFCDDIFGLKPGWVEAFADEVVRRNAAIPFKCLARVDLLVERDTIAQLRRAGCETVWVGAESGSQKILDAMDKGTTVAQIYEATARLKAAGIRVAFFLQYGYPGETLAEIQDTLRMVRECQPDEIGVSVSYPLPGTPFYERVRGEMHGKENWTDSQDLAMMYRGTYGQEFYRTLHRITHKKFRIWQSPRLFRQAARHPWRVTPGTVRRLAASVYHRMTLPALERKLHTLT